MRRGLLSQGGFALTAAALAWGAAAFGQEARSGTAALPPEPVTARETELHRAARAGDLSALRRRLQQGVRADALDASGRTALLEAVAAGNVEAARLLLAAGAGVNATSRAGRTPLIEAAEQGQMAAARLLVAAGADLDRGQRGWGTALETAERTGQTALAAMLRQAGARPSGRGLGDTVCVRPWGGDGYCGVVEDLQKTRYRIRLTEVVGCVDGCPARAECSENRPVGGAEGLKAGDLVATVSSCLTHTGVQP
jgi:ankyrin repeat protein